MAFLSGIIRDSTDGEPIWNTHVFYLTSSGNMDSTPGLATVSDVNGQYDLPYLANRTVRFTHVSYEPQEMDLAPVFGPLGQLRFENIDLIPASYEIDEIEIFPDEEAQPETGGGVGIGILALLAAIVLSQQ